ncbi:hypothetical protein AN189_17520 [Loktanella sp. 3ANDIMAR09]|nr:hypothetical protein AN189_17520 [Loktanella sp. 3ANDIMAR09]
MDAAAGVVGDTNFGHITAEQFNAVKIFARFQWTISRKVFQGDGQQKLPTSAQMRQDAGQE